MRPLLAREDLDQIGAAIERLESEHRELPHLLERETVDLHLCGGEVDAALLGNRRLRSEPLEDVLIVGASLVERDDDLDVFQLISSCHSSSVRKRSSNRSPSSS